MLTSRNFAHSIRLRYALLLLGWVLYVAALNALAMALGFLLLVVDTIGDGFFFLVLAIALTVGGAVSIGFSSGVLSRKGGAAQVRSLAAVAGGLSTVVFATFLVLFPESYLAPTDIGHDSIVMARITFGMGVASLPLALFGMWCVAVAGRTSRLARYLVILICLFLILLSILLLACAYFLFFEYVVPVNGEENYFADFFALGSVWGIVAISGLYNVGRKPRPRAETNAV